jgi:hypothetical protein
MRIYELSARYDSRKSFYGKAHVIENSGKLILKSYDTEVCGIDENGVFHRYWSGESSTTMRHINEFIRQNGIDGGGVEWWRRQPVERFSWVNTYIPA